MVWQLLNTAECIKVLYLNIALFVGLISVVIYAIIVRFYNLFNLGARLQVPPTRGPLSAFTPEGGQCSL